MLRFSLAAVLVGGLLAGPQAGVVEAQAPGYQQIDIGSVRAEYVAEVLDRINDLYADWGETWATDQVDELSELYWEEALLIPPDGELRRGRDEIRAYFTEVLPDHGHIEAFMLDFDASGGMSQVFGNYMLGIQHGAQAGTTERGTLITVYVQRGRHWKIRSQVFLPG
ncbi:MAG: SgcJ/EcaC family oxidoreductase [Gemmatimonadota bacterium]